MGGWERRRRIVARLEGSAGVKVTQLAEELGVTEETIRRDLAQLKREGRVVRVHGGAVPVGEHSHDLPFEVRSRAFHEVKAALARHALRHIADGDVVAFDASSTIHELACVLPDAGLTVITNALPATAVLMARRNVRVLSTGGVLDPASRSWVGSFAEQALERVNINKLFLSSKGVDLRRGLSEVDDAQARVKRKMIDLAEEVFLLVDHSKFGVRAAVHLAQLDEIDVLITDSGVAPDVRASLAAANVPVELVAVSA